MSIKRLTTTNTKHLREIFVAGLLVLIVVVPFLIQPKAPPELEKLYCVQFKDLLGPLHVNVNCDSYAFVQRARDPELLLEPEDPRQGRPLYIVIGWALAKPFSILPPGLVGPLSPIGSHGGALQFVPEYTGFLILNGLLLLASTLLFRRLLGSTSLLSAWTLLPLVFLLSNQVTKVGFWTPHTNIFNIFVPVASMSLYCWMLPRLRTLTWLHFTFIGLLIGFGTLAYGSFAVTAGGAALCILVGEGISALRERVISKSFQSFLLLASFFLPTVVWVAIVTILTGSFYSLEVEGYRQFVWLGDSLSQGANVLLHALSVNLHKYVFTIAQVVVIPCLALAFVVAVTLALSVSRQPDDLHRSRSFAVLLYVLPAILFFGLMGFYQLRLSWSFVVPAVLLILGLEIRQLEVALVGKARFAVKASLIIVSAVYLAYWIFSSGPFGDVQWASPALDGFYGTYL